MKTKHAASFILFLVPLGTGAETQSTPRIKRLAEVRFEQDPDVKCLKFATESGDSNGGPSTHILELSEGCVVPWHYHTAEEQLMVVEGRVVTEMDGMPLTSLGPGGFALMPGKKKHQFSCKSTKGCVVFVSFDRKYDIWWVDKK